MSITVPTAGGQVRSPVVLFESGEGYEIHYFASTHDPSRFIVVRGNTLAAPNIEVRVNWNTASLAK